MNVVSVCECFDQLKMAGFALEEVFSNNLSISGNPTNLDCAVCLQTCIHPAELPCGHIFCYLCIKGIVNQGRRCAMCRHEIPVDYLDKPRLLKPMDAEITSQGFEDGHLWFYEGHNGWWQYDDRTSLELESAYQKGERCCELLIAGFLYVIDFDGMLQFRRNDPSRRRRIKRDIATTSKKGIAGLKTTKNCNSVLSNASENEPNETNQNSTGSNSLVLNNLGSLRNINGSVNSAQQTEPILSHQRMAGRNIHGYSFPVCRTASAINSNRNFEDDNSTTNYNLGSTVQNTLDWAIEQIESLNLELLNDYETIFRDYGHLESNLSQSRNRRTSSNHLNRCSVMSNSLNDSFENDLELSPEILEGSDGVNPIPPATPHTSSNRNSSISDNINEAEAQTPQSVLVSPPQPPPRSRGMPRSRSRRDFVQRSSSLNCDKFFQRFVSKK